MGLKDIGESLPPGFRFFPSDEELVCHYLCKKIANEEVLKGTLVEIDLHTCEPWELPEVAKLNGSEWFFFSFRDRKYTTGFRANRATACGYWKATGKDRVILDPKTRQVIGMRKTLVFYRNRAPNGIKTAWIMHEFRMEAPHMPPKEDWVLCRVFNKSKGENNNTTTSSSPTPPMAEQSTMPTNYGYQSCDSFTSKPPTEVGFHSGLDALDSTPMLNPPGSLLQLLKEGSPSNYSINDMLMDASKIDGDAFGDDDHRHDADEYGFMWDLDLDDGMSLGLHGDDHHHHNAFGDLGLLKDDNGIVLL